MQKKRFPAWKELLAGATVPGTTKSPVKGWTIRPIFSNPVIEPKLNYAADSAAITDARVILIAAPGAVGKSALARYLAKEYQYILVDLAETGPVGDHFVSGGLFSAFGASSFEMIEAGTAGLIFDALDEARLRVTAEAFEAFLSDIANIARSEHARKIILFGRTSAVEVAWLILQDLKTPAALAEIDFFNRQEAEEFIDKYASSLDTRGIISQHRLAYVERRNELFASLSKQARKAEGSVRLDGYAPVLLAVSKVLSQHPNFAVSVAAADGGSGDFVQRIPLSILEREQGKVQAALEEKLMPLGVDSTTLYKPAEQRARLLGHIFQEPDLHLTTLPKFSSSAASSAYEEQIKEFFVQHPFLDGRGQQVGNAVFEADLFADALYNSKERGREIVLGHLHTSRNKPNPFLINQLEFLYKDRQQHGDLIDCECIGPLYDSLRAQASATESVMFVAAKVVRTDDSSKSATKIGITVYGDRAEPAASHSFYVNNSGRLRFPRGLGECFVWCDNTLEIGDGEVVELGAPGLIDVEGLEFLGSKLVVAPSSAFRQADATGCVLFSRSEPKGFVERLPRLIGNTHLAVSWPGADAFPWQQYSVVSGPKPQRPDVEPARFALRRLVLSFRSHSKGALARFEDKVEHYRMTGGEIGEKLRSALLRDKVLQKKGVMYVLDPDMLGAVLGTSYHDLKLMKFSLRCDDYLSKVISNA